MFTYVFHGGVKPGDNIGDIYNGASPGNFGWLSWTGNPSKPTLVTSLTQPGDSATYVNPNNADDHVLLPGDSVFGKPGVSDSDDVRNVLNALLNTVITVPVCDQAQGHGSNLQYHVVGFAQVVITAYQLPGANRISARFEGSTDCQSPPPPPPPSPISGATLGLSPGVAGPNVTGRVSQTTAAGTTNFLWDEMSLFSDVVLETDGVSGGVILTPFPVNITFVLF